MPTQRKGRGLGTGDVGRRQLPRRAGTAWQPIICLPRLSRRRLDRVAASDSLVHATRQTRRSLTPRSFLGPARGLGRTRQSSDIPACRNNRSVARFGGPDHRAGARGSPSASSSQTGQSARSTMTGMRCWIGDSRRFTSDRQVSHSPANATGSHRPRGRRRAGRQAARPAANGTCPRDRRAIRNTPAPAPGSAA